MAWYNLCCCHYAQNWRIKIPLSLIPPILSWCPLSPEIYLSKPCHSCSKSTVWCGFKDLWLCYFNKKTSPPSARVAAMSDMQKTFKTEQSWNTLAKALNFIKHFNIFLKLPRNFYERSLKLHWKILETSMKDPWNFYERSLKLWWKILETLLKLPLKLA